MLKYKMLISLFMDNRFKSVQEEVAQVISSGIFWISYTHVTTDLSREGIGKTGKIMAPSIALGHDIVPFTGEFEWSTYLFRHYHVSVSLYPPCEHQWRHYINGPIIWAPDSSRKWVTELEDVQQQIQRKKTNWEDFLNPDKRAGLLLAINECINLEHTRQRVYEQMTPEKRERLSGQKHEIYVFGSKLGPLVRRKIAYQERSHVEHPFAPGEIKLERYLLGMFTYRDVAETRTWVSNIAGREIPVASVDALATWEDIFPKLPVVCEYPNHSSFYESLRKSEEVKQRTRREAIECSRSN